MIKPEERSGTRKTSTGAANAGAANANVVVAFSGGGTGGHVYPGLAIIERLRSLLADAYIDDVRIVWIGSGKEIERQAVEAAGVEFFAVPSGKLRRSLSLRNILDFFKVAAGFVFSWRLLSKLRPVVLFSKGGYVSVPPCRAAGSLGIPVFTHESDVTPGLATRLNARVAQRVFVSYASTVDLLPATARCKATMTGNPVRTSIRSGDASRGRAFLGAPDGKPIVLFLGGSQGARQINDLVRDTLPALTSHAFIAHQTGETIGKTDTQTPGYRAFPYLHNEMADVLSAADIVVGRSGAGTVWEAATLGKPMVLVPLCGAGTRGDQVDNARNAASSGAAVALVGDQATPESLVREVVRLLDDGDARARMSAASRALADTDAALAIANAIVEIVRNGGRA